MNKLPTKQIYLLFIIIVGIIALSVYSTYALFTFDTETSDIVSIHTPKSLQISENAYEYQQLTIKENTVATTDIDIYNAFDYEVCYSVWYKILGDEEIQNKVQIFEQSEQNLTSSGVIPAQEHLRVTIVIINDNDTEIKVNLGTIGSQKKDLSCSLNLTSDKKVIGESYQEFGNLIIRLQSDSGIPKEIEEGYLTYKDLEDKITFTYSDKRYISNSFTYHNEVFTLEEEQPLTFQELLEKNKQKENPEEKQEIYFCPDYKKTCNILYKITQYEVEEVKVEEDIKYNYHVTKYDKLIGYSKGNVGLRKINDKDFVFFGDNPNNYIYYNCLNKDDLTTCELWRIIGFFYNEEEKAYQTKIIKNSSVGKYQFDNKIENNENKSSNVWKDSTLNKYLNENYKLINNYDIYLEESKELVERLPNLEIDIKNMKIKDETFQSDIMLLSLLDFLRASICEKTKVNQYTGECITNNWLNNIEISKEWTLTSKEVEIPEEPIIEPVLPETDIDETTEENEVETEEIEEEKKEIINYIYSSGNSITETNVNDLLDVRPVIFIKPRMLVLGGNGSFENPYIIK